MIEKIALFDSRVYASGGSLVITIPVESAELYGIKNGTLVKVAITIPKK